MSHGYFTDEKKFTVPVTDVVKKRLDDGEGWKTYAVQDGYSLQSREIKSTDGSKTTVQYRKLKDF